MGELKLNSTGIPKEIPAKQPAFGILTTVTRISHHDLIYVHHLLKAGEELSLIHDDKNPVNPWAVEVYYKGFMIGYLADRCDRITARLMQEGASVRAFIRSRKKDNLRPFESLEVEVRAVLPHGSQGS